MLENGMLEPDGLQQALDYQQEEAGRGRRILLGQALLELGLVERERLNQVITMQILQLQSALSAANRQLEQRVEQRTRDLQHALERLSELSQLKNNFIANISHELRTPLTHIKGYLDLISTQELGDLNPAQSGAIDVLQRAEARLERLIEDLIQFSLATRGEMSLDLALVDLRTTVHSAYQEAGAKAQAKGLRLQVGMVDYALPTRVDGGKIEWVLNQLLDNAIKFTPAGGLVRIEAVRQDGKALLTVSDSGIGIPAGHLEEIFEPFHQLDGSATRRYAGTGLGLALARRILDAHGARLTVESQVKGGSRFSFNLPLERGGDSGESAMAGQHG